MSQDFLPPVFTDVNQLLEKLLIKELPIEQNGIEISFKQPTREWSSKLDGPCLNLFLYDIRKNKFRQGQNEVRRKGQSSATVQRPALRLDMHYIITAWVLSGDPDEEHYLLAAALFALARHPRIPDGINTPFLPEESRIGVDFLPEALQNQPGPITLMVSEPEELMNPADVWSALDNDLRPSLNCMLTVAFDPFQPIELPMVTGRSVNVGYLAGRRGRVARVNNPPNGNKHFNPERAVYGISGMLSSPEPLESTDPFEPIRLILHGWGRRGGQPLFLEANESLTEYTFEIPEITHGDYQLELIIDSDKPSLSYTLLVIPDQVEVTQEKGGIRLVTTFNKREAKVDS